MSLEKCISRPGSVTVSLVEGYIQVNNNTPCHLHVKALEVEHTITTLVYEPGSLEPSKSAKRHIRERINVDTVIPPHDRLRIYFGPHENVDRVVVIVGDEYGREYRIVTPIIRFEEEKEQES